MAGTGVSPALDAKDLGRLLAKVDPSARLVSPRTFRRFVKQATGSTVFDIQAAHRDFFAIEGKRSAGPRAGQAAATGSGREWAILLVEPDPATLATRPRDVVLLDYWRRLFHARVEVVLEGRFERTGKQSAEIAQRIERIGQVEFEEIRSVLRQEGFLFSGTNDRTVYIEFAAYFLELRWFSPALLSHVFPSIEDWAAVDAVLALDVDAAALFDATRLSGAPNPDGALSLETTSEPEQFPTEDSSYDDEEPTTLTARRLIHRAEVAGGRGNAVRAALLRVQAARHSGVFLAGAVAEIDQLVRRLQLALGFGDAESERWRRTLPALLDRSARGFWTYEARILYDLQKVCVDHEREVFALDLFGWIFSAGRRPFRRAQPLLREVMIVGHLRSALRRLRSARLETEERTRLLALLSSAQQHAEARLRQRLRGPIEQTLRGQGLVARNIPEEVAHRKLVEELLDRIAARGFLTIGDLRDACSRSQLKLPDLAGPLEFLSGDRLLQSDRALAHALDGVYRRGEIYLRGLQRLSSLAFATPAGRFFTLFVALPYGGAFIALEGTQHLLNWVVHRVTGVKIPLMNTTTLLVIGTVALGVVNFLAFRRQFFTTVGAIVRGVRGAVGDSVAWILRRPFVQLLFAGRLATLVWRHLLKAALLTLPFWIVLRMVGLHGRESQPIIALVFAASVLTLNSRLGRDFEEYLLDVVVRAWRQFHYDFVPGLFRLIIATFDKILESVDRLLYAGDEWLRFRRGQSRWLLVVKAIFGSIWFSIAYLVRIYVNLLIEPQVNPIKHFPVVTVSHKVILPLSVTLAKILAAPLMPLGPVIAKFIAYTTIFLLPGVFGFLVWELKENWRLYKANRPENLAPVIVGAHGETIVRLLRPGFHSGTLPKLFARLRKSERRWFHEGRERAALKHRDNLHHVELEVQRLVDRELLALLHQSRTLAPLGIVGAGLEVATNRIRIGLSLPGDQERLWIAFDERDARLIAHVESPAWSQSISPEQRRGFVTALTGFYKLSGVEWLRANRAVDGAEPNCAAGQPEGGETLVYVRDVPVSWRRWVEVWEHEETDVDLALERLVALQFPEAPPKSLPAAPADAPALPDVEPA